jgi:DNA-binding response OmpR family regulator
MDVFVLSGDPLLPEFVRRPLIALGHVVEGFSDVAACAEAMARRRPRAVVVARRIGASDGKEVISRLRKAHPEAAIVLASPDDGDRTLARGAACGFLRIPFDGAELQHALGVVTRDRRLILLADDSALIHRHTVPILEEAGYEVVSAHDGEEALELHAARRPDLVITDVEMPRKDGYQVCKTLKERDPHLPVIICSALGEAHDLERGFDAGADDYLVKPAAPEELLSRVRQLFAGLEPGARERVLVVDDSPAIRHLIADSLVRQGFAVITAEDGADALEKVRNPGASTPLPQLVITDYDMPRMTGFELVHALKRDPATRDIPIMMLTARDSRRDQAQMRAVGLTSYLVKPFSVDKCVAMVERVLAERRLLAYKEASRLYISDGAVRAAEDAASCHDTYKVRAEEREIAVMFSDICGFTNMSSKLQPREVVELLNAFFDVMCPIIKNEAGDIDKFIGDCIMALFEELPGGDPAPLRAVRAGLAMQHALREWNATVGKEMMIRIGINTGKVVRGDIGSKHVRRDFTVIGDAVNRAQRFEANAPRGGVLIGPRTYERIKDHVVVEERPGLKLKGVDEPVTAYVVLKMNEGGQLAVASR